MLPRLLIFDIDATLIRPDYYHSIDQIKKGLYDPTLLTGYLKSTQVQVAIASFNVDTNAETPIGGRRFGRTILDLQAPDGNSRPMVNDEFIQCWRYTDEKMWIQHGKNHHIDNIVDFYRQKYGNDPPMVIFYDDIIENVYSASRRGAFAYWVTDGLTRQNINSLSRIGNCLQFKCQNPPDTNKYNLTLRRYSSDSYVLYLPMSIEASQRIATEFIQYLLGHSIMINIIGYNVNVF